MLVAQAQVENLELMTVDGDLASYEVNLVWANTPRASIKSGVSKPSANAE